MEPAEGSGPNPSFEWIGRYGPPRATPSQDHLDQQRTRRLVTLGGAPWRGLFRGFSLTYTRSSLFYSTMKFCRFSYAVSVVLSLWFAAQGQNLVPNPSFEEGTSQPAAWTLAYGTGRWENFGNSGNRSVSVIGTGECGPQWRTTGCPVQPGKLYLARFWMMASNAATLQAFAGWDRVNRNISVDEPWRQYLLVAAMPTNLVNPVLRFGQCRAIGAIGVDDVEVWPAEAVHLLAGGHPLGLCESVRPRKYTYQTLFSSSPAAGNYAQGNHSRCLYQHTASFDTDHWTLFNGGDVIYRHDFGGFVFTNAQISVTTIYSQGGDLIVEASTNALEWVEAGRITPPATRLLQTNAPAVLFPTTSLFVRLRTTGSQMQVSKYRVEGDMPDLAISVDGKTWYLELGQPILDLKPVGMLESPTGWVWRVELRDEQQELRRLAFRCQIQGAGGIRQWEREEVVPASSTGTFDLPLASAGAWENTARLEVDDLGLAVSLLRANVSFIAPAVKDHYFGYTLPGTANCEAWWCESLYKVSRLRLEGTQPKEAVEIAAARNEYEPFQVVLRPREALTNVQVSVSDFTSVGLPQAARISATNVEVCLVEYVPIQQPSDYSGTAGEHPDPLVPVTGPFAVPANTNQPLWLTVYVPKDAPAGLYEAVVTIHCDGTDLTVPVRLRVFDFTLPDTTHTKTSYNVWVDDYWHKTSNNDQRRAVFDLYLENFRRHRVTPTMAQVYSPWMWSFVGEEVTIHTGAFDIAMARYLDEFGFTSFELMNPPDLLGPYWRYSEGYNRMLTKVIRAIMAHLREKGWAEKTYFWWYDEPQPVHYPKLIPEMRAAQLGAADLPRLSTVQPEAELYGHIDIWVPLATTWRWAINRVRARQALNEELWWYICCWPAYPCANYLIDHPAMNHRIRFWMAEGQGLAGDLYWCTMWYRGTNVSTRNPWVDPMSIGSNEVPLGNGDGMLLYPPVKTPPTSPLIAGPINSLRWELVRESLEDGEYFWLLRQGLQRARGRLGIGHPAIAEGEAARQQAIGLTRSIDDFEKDPQKLYAARLRLAEAIEALDDGTPTIVTQPGARTGKVGGSVSLRVEALGWPLPGYQWARDSVALPGATTSVLSLTNLTLADAGTYTATVSNALGTVTSAGAKVVVLTTGTEAPQILVQPADLERRTGEKAVLTATVVGTAPLSYQWFTAGSPIPGETNTTLLFTNLAASQFGTYQLVASNLAGSVTSAPARIISVDAPILQANWSPANNGLQLRFSTRRRPATVLVSSNYTSWSELIRVQPMADPVILLDTQATQHTARYYRVRTE